jgi:hypothetical protein
MDLKIWGTKLPFNQQTAWTLEAHKPLPKLPRSRAHHISLAAIIAEMAWRQDFKSITE